MTLLKTNWKDTAVTSCWSDVGVEGQEKLLAAKVLIIGAGGLGCPAALYLAAAGVGTIGIVDNDCVEVSNLQRQIAHFTKDINVSKVESAAEKMLAINPDITVKTYKDFLCADNINSIIDGYDFVIDGTDNFPTKFLVNDACVLKGHPLFPWRHSAVQRPDNDCRAWRVCLLPVLFPETAAARCCTILCPGRCSRCHRRYARYNTSG